MPSSLTSPKKRLVLRKEAAFQRAVEEKAQMLGWFPFHIALPMRSPAGFPDLLLVKDRLEWFELKVFYENGRAGKVSGVQERFHDMLRGAGQSVHVVYDDDEGWAVIMSVLSDERLTVA